jgi:hypothetical protein
MERNEAFKKKMMQETSKKQAANKASFMLVSCLSYSSILKAEATYFSKMQVDFH